MLMLVMITKKMVVAGGLNVDDTDNDNGNYDGGLGSWYWLW